MGLPRNRGTSAVADVFKISCRDFPAGDFSFKGLLCALLGRKEYQIVIHFTPFKDHPEFYAKYQLRNAKDSHLFTDRFNLIVLSLTQIKRATKEDKALGLDKWARLFKSKTWEDIRMVASDNKYMTSAIETAYLSSEDRNIIKIAREREDYLRSEAYKDAQLKKQSAQIKKQKTQIAQLTESNAAKDSTIAELKARIKELESKN